MRKAEINRRGLIAAPVAMAGLGALAGPAAAEGGFVLATRPLRVFKTPDRSHENTESWTFSLLVQTLTPDKLSPAGMIVEHLKGGAVLRTTTHTAAGLEPLTFHTSLPARMPDGT